MIDWGTGSAAYDGLSMAPGTQNLTSNGALRLVKRAGAYAAGYDLNGNMTSRIVDGAAYLLAYDAEIHLTGVSGGGVSASFVYDGDGNRVKGTVGSTITIYIGNYFEWICLHSLRSFRQTIAGSTGTMKRYYYAGETRVAMREGSTLSWLLSDHLGSTSITANSSGVRSGEVRYRAWGEDRFTWGTTPTSYRYTGQRSEMSSLGLFLRGKMVRFENKKRFCGIDIPAKPFWIIRWGIEPSINRRRWSPARSPG